LLVPLLALGAELGLWLGLLCALAFPGMALEPEGFAVVGMAARFTAIARAPLTAIVLVTEMTANVTMLLPMIATCFAAMLVATLFGDMSILDSLRERLLDPSKRTVGDVHQQDIPKDGSESRCLPSAALGLRRTRHMRLFAVTGRSGATGIESGHPPRPMRGR
jgi:CIC family chloride channel protein